MGRPQLAYAFGITARRRNVLDVPILCAAGLRHELPSADSTIPAFCGRKSEVVLSARTSGRCAWRLRDSGQSGVTRSVVFRLWSIAHPWARCAQPFSWLISPPAKGPNIIGEKPCLKRKLVPCMKFG